MHVSTQCHSKIVAGRNWNSEPFVDLMQRLTGQNCPSRGSIVRVSSSIAFVSRTTASLGHLGLAVRPRAGLETIR